MPGGYRIFASCDAVALNSSIGVRLRLTSRQQARRWRWKTSIPVFNSSKPHAHCGKPVLQLQLLLLLSQLGQHFLML